MSYTNIFAQLNGVPNYETFEETDVRNTPPNVVLGNLLPPNTKARAMAEWEELQALNITWRSGDPTSYKKILSEIAKAASAETTVIITCEDSLNVKSYFQSNNYALSPKIKFHIYKTNSIWVRDYGANTIYLNDIDSLSIVDWVYNRPSRGLDDAQPNSLATYTGLPIYNTSTFPNDMVHTGGNFMSDGLGDGFSSRLVVGENAGNKGAIPTKPKTETEVRSIMKNFMGIQNYTMMEILPYDGIHHIDMHMKLIDEETLLVGEFPTGVADGPQIEANIAYILKNYKTAYGTPFKIKRVIMPKEKNGGYNGVINGSTYQTYANAVFCNKTVILPTFAQANEDSIGIATWKKALPGYTIFPVPCSSIITSLGAIHCITKEIGVADPLWITYKKLEDVSDAVTGGYTIEAQIKHKSGVKSAKLYYKTDLSAAYQALAMTQNIAGLWTANIPSQKANTSVYYYVEAEAKSGKMMQKPIVAPKGYYSFKVTGVVATNDLQLDLQQVFPNPASAMTCIPIRTENQAQIVLTLSDINGRIVQNIANETLQIGDNKFFFDASKYPSGVYFVTAKTNKNVFTQKVIIR